MSKTIRILIVTGHAAVRADMRTILQLADGVEVVGEAANRPGALRLAEVLTPDVTLIDLEMPAQAGFTILREIKTRQPSVLVIALTAHDYPAARERAAGCGADAVIIKGTDLGAMLEIIRKIA